LNIITNDKKLTMRNKGGQQKNEFKHLTKKRKI
jgi:hypothetical protein